MWYCYKLNRRRTKRSLHKGSRSRWLLTVVVVGARCKGKVSVKEQRVEITMAELQDAINTQKSGKTAGPTGCAEMLKRIGQGTRDALLHIFKLSWRTGKVPTEWSTYVKALLKSTRTRHRQSPTGPSR
eukprot:TRINITY_DN8752_c0_g1_i2.p2 TRINITY_DN8752_c0_g1~~TRINITY_DN8752_c0_g1_i2.p2  ORF type:complete len:128 (-),score=13.41 TRINITY_DN8752_c0_g1_i2:33-416(-)